MIKVIESNLGFWPHRDFDPDFMIRSVFGMCWFLAVDSRFRNSGEADTEKQAAQIVQLIFDGLLSKRSVS